MPRARTGDVLGCEVCGLKVIVDEECGCASIDIICCEEPMVNLGATKTKRIPAVNASKKTTVKKIGVSRKKQRTKKKIVEKAAKKSLKGCFETVSKNQKEIRKSKIINLSGRSAILTFLPEIFFFFATTLSLCRCSLPAFVQDGSRQNMSI